MKMDQFKKTTGVLSLVLLQENTGIIETLWNVINLSVHLFSNSPPAEQGQEDLCNNPISVKPRACMKPY